MARVRTLESSTRDIRRTEVTKVLRDDLGLTFKQIGDYFGLHPTSINHLYHHGSTTSHVRQTNGKNTNTSTGVFQWTRLNLIRAGERFIREHGRPPVNRDFDTSGLYWPNKEVFVNEFGSWNNYMLELGYSSSRGRSPVKIK